MAIELKIPEVGESITEVQIAQWLKAEGESVQKGESLVVVDSEKTTFELPAPDHGRLTRILHQAGDTVPVGAVVGHLEVRNAEPKPAAGIAEKTAAQSATGTEAKPRTTPPPAVESRPGSSVSPAPIISEDQVEPGVVREKEPARETERRNEMSSAVRAKPEAHAPSRKTDTAAPPDAASKADHARKSQDIDKPVGSARTSGPDGEGEVEVVPMSMLRRTVARRLVEAKQQMAMLTTFNEVDMSAVQTLRREHQAVFEQRHQIKLGLMSFFVKAAVDALKQFPQLNAEVRGQDIVYHNYFNLGVAMATERGLVVPVLRQADQMSFAEAEKAISEFAARAKEAKLKPEELEGATFTITNGGVFGSLLSTPIINPPQTGILGLHTIQERPIAVQGQVVIRPMMYVALTYDHRIVDGREAVLFLRRIKETIESPARLLLEV